MHYAGYKRPEGRDGLLSFRESNRGGGEIPTRIVTHARVSIIASEGRERRAIGGNPLPLVSWADSSLHIRRGISAWGFDGHENLYAISSIPARI